MNGYRDFSHRASPGPVKSHLLFLSPRGQEDVTDPSSSHTGGQEGSIPDLLRGSARAASYSVRVEHPFQEEASEPQQSPASCAVPNIGQASVVGFRVFQKCLSHQGSDIAQEAHPPMVSGRLSPPTLWLRPTIRERTGLNGQRLSERAHAPRFPSNPPSGARQLHYFQKILTDGYIFCVQTRLSLEEKTKLSH